MKELTLDEISLLEEMKSNCLKKGQYIDDKAKDKFKMLCHLEDFSIAYYELLDVIKELREEMENTKHISVEDVYHVIEHEKKLNEILDKVGEE